MENQKNDKAGLTGNNEATKGMQQLSAEDEKKIEAGTCYDFGGPLGGTVACTTPGGGSTLYNYGLHCIVTTATLSILHDKNDDCDELNTFRTYRDNWLMKQPGGPELVKEYYEIAPAIVNNINARPDHKEIYTKFWDTVLVPCLSLMESGKNEEAKTMYNQAITELKNLYLN